jgi:hypothetical protein
MKAKMIPDIILFYLFIYLIIYLRIYFFFTYLYTCIIHNVRNYSTAAAVQLVCEYGKFKNSSHIRGTPQLKLNSKV